MDFAKGRCIVMKKEYDNCLVIPKGTFSSSRDAFISEEGILKIKELSTAEDAKVKENAVCCMNRQVYDKCLVVPTGVLHPKVSMTISFEAIDGILGAIKNRPVEDKKEKAPKKPTKKELAAEKAAVEKESALSALIVERDVMEENIMFIEDSLKEASPEEAPKLQEELTNTQDALKEKLQQIDEFKQIDPSKG
jgi:hypothetical protein